VAGPLADRGGSPAGRGGATVGTGAAAWATAGGRVWQAAPARPRRRIAA